MVYLLYGTKDFQIDAEIQKICKDFDDLNISKYDLDNDLLSIAIEDCQTVSMFSQKKVVIIKNASMFSGSTSKDSEIIEKYLNNSNPDTTLILTLNNDKIDERKKITKLIKKVGKVLVFNDNLDPRFLVRNLLKDYEISYDTINLFIDRVGSNPLIIQNEINKIKVFKGNDYNITDEDILNLTTKIIDIDIFKLIDDIIKKNKNSVMEIYHEMLKMNEEPLKIIIMLANQFRIMYQAKELLKKGYSEKSIAETLKIHPYRVKLALQNSRTYDSQVLLKFLDNLADIDINIKSGKTNKNLAFEMFLLQL